MRNPRLDVTRKGLACATAAERAKHATYDVGCRRRQWRMCAFAVESYGALGKEARQLLHTLASKCDEMTAHAFLQHAAASVSVALQAGNAAIAFGGLQRLRVAQLSWDLPMSPGLHSHPSRRRSHHHAAHIRDSELDISAAYHAGFLFGGGSGGGCMRQVGGAAA